MSLPLIILVLLAGGAVSAFSSRYSGLPRKIAFITLLITLPLAATIVATENIEWRRDWIPQFGISLSFGSDGLSSVLIALTILLGWVALVAEWHNSHKNEGFFFLNLLWTLAGVVGVFGARDLFLFFVFWEVMLVPMYFLIALWGHENRLAASMKFFIFTQASGLLLFAAIIACAWIGFRSTGRLSFDYSHLTFIDYGSAAPWLLLGFFVAFAVKLPVVPFHTWLPDAHTEAPTGASVILAGILLKTGAYGMLRFAIPFFPQAVREFAPLGMGLGVLGIWYGAVLAYGQHDLKRMVAYTSVSHMGFVLLGIFAFTQTARQGVVVQLVAHGFSTGALFVLVGALQERLQTRDLSRMGGLWSTLPRLSAFGLFFALASLGLPGLANFIGEFLILAGAFSGHPFWVAVAALGIVAAAVYSLAMVQRAFHGREISVAKDDASARELWLLGAMAIMLVALGIAPQPILDRISFGMAAQQ